MQWLGGERRVSPPQVARLYRKIYWRLYAGLGGHATDAEDATQAAFLEAVKNRASIRKGLTEYVGGVGRMKLREHYRRRSRHERTVSLTDVDELPAEGVDASMAVEVALEVGRLVRALEQLPLDDQRGLALVYGRELRNVEAAACLGVPQVVFDNLIGHARARLRRVLERDELTGAARRRSSRSFQQWVASVLGPQVTRHPKDHRMGTASCSR
jgi:RNA polymerase sigma factor (sigma-70 family)